MSDKIQAVNNIEEENVMILQGMDDDQLRQVKDLIDEEYNSRQKERINELRSSKIKETIKGYISSYEDM